MDHPLFILCIVVRPMLQDVDLTVSLKAIFGKHDQGGGLVWRTKDSNNYYVARVNPLENNYRVYKVVAGKREQLGSANVQAPANRWHTMRVVQQGSHIQCFLNDRLHLDVKDETFQEAGKIGLWTKADAITHFDGLRIASPKQ